MIGNTKPKRITDDIDITGGKVLNDINIFIMGFTRKLQHDDVVIKILNNNNKLPLFMGTIVNVDVNIISNNIIKSSYDDDTNNVMSLHDKCIDKINKKVLITGKTEVILKCSKGELSEILLISTIPFCVEFLNKEKVLANSHIAYKLPPFPIQEEQPKIEEKKETIIQKPVNEEPEKIIIPIKHTHHYKQPHHHPDFTQTINDIFMRESNNRYYFYYKNKKLELRKQGSIINICFDEEKRVLAYFEDKGGKPLLINPDDNHIINYTGTGTLNECGVLLTLDCYNKIDEIDDNYRVYIQNNIDACFNKEVHTTKDLFREIVVKHRQEIIDKGWIGEQSQPVINKRCLPIERRLDMLEQENKGMKTMLLEKDTIYMNHIRELQFQLNNVMYFNQHQHLYQQPIQQIQPQQQQPIPLPYTQKDVINVTKKKRPLDAAIVEKGPPKKRAKKTAK